MYTCDFNATTPLHNSVAELLAELARRPLGNPSSPHASGRFAAQILDSARTRVAEACDWPRSGVVFTSGATEAIFIAIAGTVFSAPAARRRIILSAVEHKAVQSAAQFAASQVGMRVQSLPVTADGVIDLAAAAEALDSDVALLCVMGANNETGVLQPIEELATLAREHGVPLLSDLCQMPGKAEFRRELSAVDMAVISSHKVMGPRGAGALLVDPALKKTLTPVLHGGGQEGGLRGGTENVSAIAGFGLAMSLASDELADRRSRMALARDAFERQLVSIAPGALVHGANSIRLPNTSFIAIPGVDADDLLHALPQLEASTGSACQSAAPTPSHVLLAMGVSPAVAQQSLRLSFPPGGTQKQIQESHAEATAGREVADLIGSAAQQLREAMGAPA